MRRVLVAFGSQRGSTAGIAVEIAEALRARGFDVACEPASAVREVGGYDAVIVGGALYAGRWHRDARRFVARHRAALGGRPTWLFSSGPLDDGAAKREIPPVRAVARWIERIGARGHATFGGRLARDAKGFVASSLARRQAGDWRDWDRIRAWAGAIGDTLEATPAPVAAPAPAPHRARWPSSVLGAAVLVGWFAMVVALLRSERALQLGYVAMVLAAGIAALAWRVGVTKRATR